MRHALAVIAIVVAGSAFAAERTEKQQLLAELLELLDVKALTQVSIDTMFDRLAGIAIDGEQLSDEQRAAFEIDREEMRAFSNRLYTRLDFARYGEQVYAPIFDKHFTADELRALIAFLKTKPGQKLLAALPELNTSIMRGTELVEAAAREAQEEIAKEQDAKHPWRRTMADMRTIATALEARATDESSYPDVSFDALEPLLVPVYLRALPKVDSWGTPFLYVGGGEHYRIVSAGADRRFEWNARQLETWKAEESPEPRLSESMDADIIFQDGFFTQQPEAAGQQQ